MNQQIHPLSVNIGTTKYIDPQRENISDLLWADFKLKQKKNNWVAMQSSNLNYPEWPQECDKDLQLNCHPPVRQ